MELFRGLNVVNIDRSRDIRIDQIIQQVIIRFPYLCNDHKISLERFIREHENALFKGRLETLETLDSWLFGKNSPPNLLLCGPGGRGKSALLVQWVAALRQKSESIPGIIFLPISRRHELSKDFDFFPALAVCLASFLPEAVILPDEADQTRAFVQRTFEKLIEANTPLLVVIDGLDEADGWMIGPSFLPDRQFGHTLRIVVSARSEVDDMSGQQWLRRLGWGANSSVIYLNALNDDAVRELLMAATEKPQPKDVLFEMVAYCSGDPLVTQILIQQIRENKFDLGKMGIADTVTDPLSRVLKEWYEQALSSASDAVKSELHNLISALVKAKGPLTRADLAVVMDVPISKVDLGLQSFKTLLAGNFKEGYSFAHQRMAEILGRVIGTEDRNIDNGFIRLIEFALSKAMICPVDVPMYPLRHAAVHIVGAAVSSQIMKELLCASWLKAHFIRLGHVRGFLELADSIVQYARADNMHSAMNGKILSLGPLEYAGTLWRAVAVENMSLRLGRDSDATEDQSFLLEKIREELHPTCMPTFSDPVKHLRTLIHLKSQLHSDLADEYEALLRVVVDAVIRKIFTYEVSDDYDAIELLQKVRPKFDLEAYIGSINNHDRRLAAWWCLINSGRTFDRNVVFQQAIELLTTTSSLKLKAEISVFLTYAKVLPFEEAYQALLSLAQLDYQSAKSAASMAAELLGWQPEQRSVAELEDILDRFRMSVHDRGIEAPLIGTSLRCCVWKERRLLWHNFYQLEFWSAIETAIEYGPIDWTSEEINAFTIEIGGRTSAPAEADFICAPAEGGAHPLWRQAYNVAAVLAIIALKAVDVTARRRAMVGVLDNLEFIPSAEWWPQPAGVLGKVLPLMRYDIASTDEIKSRATSLADWYETEKNTPLTDYVLSTFYKLPIDTFVEEAVILINKWGDKFLDLIERYTFNDDAISVAMSLAITSEKIFDPELRREMARILLKNTSLDHSTRKLLEQQNNLPNFADFSEQRRLAWVKRDRELLCNLLNGIAVSDSNVTAITIRWLLDVGSEAHALLSVPTIPPGWTVPSDLVHPLTSIMKHWSDLHAGNQFPAILAARMPSCQILEIVEHLLAKKIDEPPFIAWDVLNILSAIEDIKIASAVESKYLTVAISENFSDWHSDYRWFNFAQNNLSVVWLPDKWLACRLAHLSLRNQDGSDTVSQIAHEAVMQRHQNVRQSFSLWVLSKLDTISDAVFRAELRYKVGGLPKPDELQAVRDLLFRVLDGTNSICDLNSVLQLLIASDTDGQLRHSIDSAIADTDQSNFGTVIDALGESITIENIRATLPFALYAVTYTGSITPRSSYFGHLSDEERNIVFRVWRGELKIRGIIEDEQRFINRIADVATSQFASEVLHDLLQPEVDCLFWRKTIIDLLARLSSENADTFVDQIIRIVQAYDENEFATALISRLTPRNRKAVLAASICKLSPIKADDLRSVFCLNYPELLDSKIIGDALKAAESNDSSDLSWILLAPAATLKQRDHAWAILLKRMRDSGFASTISALITALPLLSTFSSNNQEIFDCIFASIFALEEEFSG